MSTHEADLQSKLSKSRGEVERLQRRLAVLENSSIPVGVPMEVEIIKDPHTDRITMIVLGMADGHEDG